MSKTLTKTIKFEEVMKIMKQYVTKTDTRPAIKYVYNDGQYLVATNSHVLIRINTDYITDIPSDYQQGYLFVPKTMENKGNDMNYPNVSRLIPNYSNTTISLDSKTIKELQNALKYIKKSFQRRTNNHFKLDFMDNSLTITGYENKNKVFEECESAVIEDLFIEGESISLRIDTRYLSNALTHVNKLIKLNGNKGELSMISHLRPMYFKANDVFDILILPIRVY